MSRYPAVTSPSRQASGEGPWPGEDLAQLLYQHYFSRLLAMVTTRYRWLGFGVWIDPMRVEYLLATQGLCAFTFVRQKEPLPAIGELLGPDPERTNGEILRVPQHISNDRFTVTQATVNGYLDDTFTPSGYRTFAPTGANGISFNTNLPLEMWKGVPIWGDANRSRYDLNTIMLFARRLAKAALVVDTNLVQTMRGKVAVSANPDKLKSTQVLMEGVSRGIDMVTSDRDTIANLEAIDLGVHPDTVERSHVVAMRLWSEALEALGIESPAAEKKERMVVDEVNGDRSQIAAIRRLTLTPRKHAATLINRRYFGGEPVIEVIDQW